MKGGAAKPIASAAHGPSGRRDAGGPESRAGAAARLAAAAPALAGLFALAVYAATAAPGAWWGDGLELTTAAKVLGIPHPPGYPLYTILGHLLLSIFTGADAGRVMTLFSSAMAALSAALIGAVAWLVLRDGAVPADARPARGAASMTALGFTLVAAFSWTLWDQATFAEVYPFSLVLVAAMTLAAAWPGRGGEAPGPGRVALITFLAGLSALHHYSAAAAGPLVLLSVLDWGRRRARPVPHLALLLFIFTLCLSGYAYLPLRAAANPPLNFGNPDSWAGLLWMLRGGQYGQIQGLSGGLRPGLAGAERWLLWWGEQVLGPGDGTAPRVLGAVLVLSAAAGNALLAMRRGALGLGALAMIAATLLFGAVYRIPDIEGYFLPALPAAAVGWAELVRRAAALPSGAAARLIVGATAGTALVLAGLGLLVTHARMVDKSWDRGPEVWAGAVLDALPEGAVVLTRQAADSEIYALWYAQMVEGKRPDVTVFGTGFIFSGWYGRYFEAEGRPRVPVFTTDRAPGSKQDYDIALVGGVIVPNLKERRVFTTFQDPTLEEYFLPRSVADLLPAEYYERTAYRLNPPGPRLYELTRNLQLEPVAEALFRDMYGPQAASPSP